MKTFYRPPFNSESSLNDICDLYWKGITKRAPPYGAGVDGTYMVSNDDNWNLNSLKTYLRTEIKHDIPGINTPFIYFGAWGSTFAFHTEDIDMPSINIMHYGSPKLWYIVPPKYGKALEKVMDDTFEASKNQCSAHYRHKLIVISQDALQQNNNRSIDRFRFKNGYNPCVYT